MRKKPDICDLCKGEVIAEELPNEKHLVCGSIWVTTKKAILFCNNCSKKIREARKLLKTVRAL